MGVYRTLLLAAVLEFLLIILQLLWLGGRLVLAAAEDREHRRFAEACGPTFLAAVDGPAQRALWLLNVARWRPETAATYIHTYLRRTEGAYHDAVASLYRDAGLHLHDLRMLRSWRWPRRALALRRLSEVALPGDDIHVTVEARDPYPVRISTLVLLAKVGGADDMLDALSTLRVPRRLMEQPLHAALVTLPPEMLSDVMEAWEGLPDPIVRRVLLLAAAERAPVTCLRWMEVAASDPDAEIRVGACMAAGRLGTPEAFRLLLGLLGDADWVVRARAASALGAHGEPSGVDALGFALGDPVPWVRQNAATSLRLLGDEGLGRLRSVAAASQDPLARRTAEAEIRNHEVLVEAQGGKP